MRNLEVVMEIRELEDVMEMYFVDSQEEGNMITIGLKCTDPNLPEYYFDKFIRGVEKESEETAEGG